MSALIFAICTILAGVILGLSTELNYGAALIFALLAIYAAIHAEVDKNNESK